MATTESGQDEDTGLEPDESDEFSDLDDLPGFGRDPEPQEDQPCGFCGRLVTDADLDSSVWVVNGDRYSPFCNSFHRDAFMKVGLWKEETRVEMPALALDDD